MRILEHSWPFAVVAAYWLVVFFTGTGRGRQWRRRRLEKRILAGRDRPRIRHQPGREMAVLSRHERDQFAHITAAIRGGQEGRNTSDRWS